MPRLKLPNYQRGQGVILFPLYLPKERIDDVKNKKLSTEKLNKRVLDGANWNDPDDHFTQLFYDQNLSQFWRPEDISLQPDLNVWETLDDDTKDCYAKNLLMLTYLDTYQGDIGMNVISRSISSEYHQRKALLNFMASMENAVHAPSYSTIFSTYVTKKEINALFKWGEENEHLQAMLKLIIEAYEDLDRATYERDYGEGIDQDLFNEIQYRAFVASVNLESCLFYSGFYYPLHFYGMGKLMQAGEIINLIIRDESIHGLYISMLAKELYEKLSPAKQKELKEWTTDSMAELYFHQAALIDEMYVKVGLDESVKTFAKYNANKAIMSLGFEPIHPGITVDDVDPVVLNGLNTETKTMDNFSMKGNGYQKIKVESLTPSDFYFEGV